VSSKDRVRNGELSVYPIRHLVYSTVITLLSPRCPVASSKPAESAPVEPSQRKPCFVISPIGSDDSDIRKRADQVLKHIIKKALSDIYTVERADDISKPGLITLQIIERLMKAPMVVADLTDANANVYYELAIRHFVKRPVVHLITEGQQPPFDVAQMRYIQYDLTNPDSVERAGLEVREHATACERGEVPFTPIQFVEMLDSARHGEGGDQFVSLALGIQAALSNLQSEVRQIRRGAFIGEDFQRALAERASNALLGSGLVSLSAMVTHPDKIVFSAARKGGGKQFEVVVPTNTPLEAVEGVVKGQLQGQQPPPAPPIPPNYVPPPR
jgi:hypothetical protein